MRMQKPVHAGTRYHVKFSKRAFLQAESIDAGRGPRSRAHSSCFGDVQTEGRFSKESAVCLSKIFSFFLSFLEMKTLGIMGKEEVGTSKDPKKSPGEGSVLCYLINYEIIPSTVLFTCPQLTLLCSMLCSKTAVIDSHETGELACHVSICYGEGPFAFLSFYSS